MLNINLLTVCTNIYPMNYAEKLIRRVRQVSKLNITPYCLTDRPQELNGWAQPLPRKINAAGWWNKTLLLDPDMPAGWNLYMDIDIVVLQNFDAEIEFAVRQARQVACVADTLGWHGIHFSSSMMIFKTGAMANIFHEFMKSPEALYQAPGGDQVWMGPQLNDLLYLNETYPNLKKNFKFDIIIQKPEGGIDIPMQISDEIKLIDCGGNPKPHELAALPYIYNNWQRV
jgi:hypothetical protein